MRLASMVVLVGVAIGVASGAAARWGRHATSLVLAAALLGTLLEDRVKAQPSFELEGETFANQLGFVSGEAAELVVLARRRISPGTLHIDPPPTRMLIVKRALDSFTGLWAHRVRLWPGRETLVKVSTEGGGVRTVKISTEPYRALERDLMRSYYLQRCGLLIVDRQGEASRAVCHLDDGLRSHNDLDGAAGSRVAAIGGWHDAGDYGKYVATTSSVSLELLTRYERFAWALQADDLSIPESSNGAPDLLDEVRVALDWLLRMQRSDGAVYRKLAGHSWPMDKVPSDDRQPRELFGVSSPETAKAAAAWALAARVYRDQDAHVAGAYLAAAERAWSFLVARPELVFEIGARDDSGSGPYRLTDIDREPSLRVDSDDRLAAAVELWLTTSQPKFAQAIEELLPAYAANLFEWKDVASQSLLSLLWQPKPIPPHWRTLVRRTILARARQGLSRSLSRPWANANDRFVWGSNKLVAEEGVLMLAAFRLTGDRRYYLAAWRQLHYLLGANPLGKSFVTGHGDNPVRHINHLFVRASGKTLPGLLVGGPNEQEQSNIAPRGRGMLS
ncbi:MAG: hypothetical protein RLZZ450_4840, partial [Pseudomonadota bacterium]